MSGIMSMLLGAKSAIAVAVDEFFNRVTLLLPGNGTNGAQNNTFLDSSTNNFTITRNGNTTQGTFSPFSQTGWSNYLDGTGDYLTVADNAVLDMGSSSFTMEFWTFLTGTASTYQAYISKRSGTGVYGGVSLYLTSSRTLNLQATLNGSSWGVDITTTSTVSQNEWVHIAVVRNGNVWTVYINGTSGATTTVSGTVPDNSSAFTIGAGAADGGHNMVACYISNFRLVKGTALYTANFTPSTSPLTKTSQGATASEVELLTCQDNRFLDNSDNAFTITVNGNPSVQAFSPFAPTAAYSAATVGGSGYFDGSGDYLIAPASTNAAFAFGTGDFSIELWTYLPSVSAYGRLFTSSANNSNMDFAGGGAITYFDGGSYSGGTLVANAWQHIVVTRQSGTLRTFLNGVMQANASNSTNLSTNSQYAFAAATNGANTTQQYMAGIRVVKGGIPSAYSTSSTTNGTQIFTPPTAPLTGSESLTAGSVSLLCNFTNAGITDATAKNDLETVGNAQISTTQSKFGGSSISFDGTGDYLTFPASQNWVFGTGDFTIEFWLYANSLSSTAVFIECRNNTVGPVIFYDAGALRVNFNSVGGTLITGGSLSTATWHHIALSRSGSSTRLFVNGTQSGSTATDTNNYSNNTLVVAASYLFTQTLNGYIDDLRITKYARYTANFSVPTTAFALQ